MQVGVRASAVTACAPQLDVNAATGTRARWMVRASSGEPLGTVKAQLHRARELLRKSLGAVWAEART